MHLKSYKYSSVDKSLISNYILKHYVRSLERWGLREYAENIIVEWICPLTAVMACAKHGYFVGILLHPFERHMSRNLDAGFGRAGKI